MSYFAADNRGALRDLEGLEKLVDFVGNKVEIHCTLAVQFFLVLHPCLLIYDNVISNVTQYSYLCSINNNYVLFVGIRRFTCSSIAGVVQLPSGCGEYAGKAFAFCV